MDAELKITYVRSGGRGSFVTLTVSVGDEVIAVEKLDVTRPKVRAEFLERLSDNRPGIDEALVAQELLRIAAEAAKPAEPAKAAQRAPTDAELLAAYDEEVLDRLDSMPSEAVRGAEQMLRDPNLVDRILADISKLGVVGEWVLALTIYLTGVSRLLMSPLGGIVQGVTSSGKSYAIERVARLFPEEATLIATHITTMALYYLPEGSLMHRFVVAGERSRVQNDETAEATRALREMRSSGRLSKAVPMKDGKSGRMTTALLEQVGPIAYVESTTLTRIFDEDANRCLLLTTDESPEQTARVIAAAAERARTDAPDVEAVILRHHAMQRNLKRVDVKIPYADRLAEAMPTDRPEARRAISHALGMIRAVALLHQRQRAGTAVEHGDAIQATLTDYVIARQLLIGPLGLALGGALPQAVANLARRLEERYGDEEFTTSQAARDDSIISSRNKMAEYLRTLADAGVVELVQEGRGNKPHLWRVVGEVPIGGARWLPTVDQLENPACVMA